jgi:hypothetical protein
MMSAAATTKAVTKAAATTAELMILINAIK